MKKDHCARIQVGIAMTFLVCHNCSALTVTLLSVASEVSVSALISDSVKTQNAKANFPNFTSASDIASSDGSTASASIMTTFRDGTTFTGYGRVSFAPGTDPMTGAPVLTAGGEANTYLSFTLDAPAHYEYVSICEGSSTVQNLVYFINAYNYNGTTESSGTLQPGVNIVLLGGNNNESDTLAMAAATWYFAMQLTPTNIPPRFTPSQKSAFDQAGHVEIQTWANTVDEEVAAADPQIKDALAQAALQQLVQASLLASQFLDPVDTNYTALAQVASPAVIPLVASNNITQLEADAFNAYLTNLSKSSGVGAAWGTSINRAQGAATAGDASWDTAQMSAAVQFEARLAALIDQEPALRSNVVAQFEAAGFPAITVTLKDAINLQMEIAANGLPASLLADLAALGASADTTTNIEGLLLTSDPATMAGSFPQSFVNTNFDAAQFSVAATLRDTSLTLINPAMLSSGQFRFDLPTEPGYTYTIQVAQDRTNPSGWTTILTNNATTALLSFTNSPLAGRQAAFYRATHN